MNVRYHLGSLIAAMSTIAVFLANQMLAKSLDMLPLVIVVGFFSASGIFFLRLALESNWRVAGAVAGWWSLVFTSSCLLPLTTYLGENVEDLGLSAFICFVTFMAFVLLATLLWFYLPPLVDSN